MKKWMILAALIVSGSAQAQTTCSNCYAVMGGNSTSVLIEPSFDNCDSNKRTPAEALECKLAYWRKNLEEAQARKDKAEKDIAAANERISAFTEAKRHP